jgi:ATP-dependent helicase HrpB
MSSELPIYELEKELVRTVAGTRRFILTAPTGSGKSTQVPQMLIDHDLLGSGEVVVLQPRRIAARLLAGRVARERRARLGGEVGYQVRFEDVTSRDTRLTYVTEGILLRRMMTDPGLTGVGAILFDEFHERHLYGDLTLGLALQVQSLLRPDLLLGVMSATLETGPLHRHLGGCPILRAEGRLYPVEIRHVEKTPDPARCPPWQAAAEALGDLLEEGVPGDALIFMPGAYEISRTIQAVQALPAARGMAVLPLHGELPVEAQDAAVSPAGRRKVVVATNVAETSLTIEGIRIVIDSGLARKAKYDAWRGINTLLVESISRASADQRAGRAGRTAPGVCVRLWSEREHAGRPAAELPEVRRLDLSEALLLLKAAGSGPVREFPWLDAPEPKALERAETLLDDLGATDGPDGPITGLGRRMALFPLHPRYSRMLLAAEGFGCVREAAWMAALTEGRSVLVRRTDSDTEERRERELGEETESDFARLIRAWQRARETGYDLEACRRLGLQAQAARQAGQAADLFLKVAQRAGLRVGESGADPADLARCLLTAFPDHVARRVDGGTLRCQIVHGRKGVLDRDSAVRRATLIAAAEIREVEAGRGEIEVRLSLCSAIRIEWLEELFPRHFSRAVRVEWDSAARRVTAEEERRYHDLPLETRRLDRPPAEEAARLLADEVNKGKLVLQGWNNAVEQWVLRVNFLAGACPDLELPEIAAAEREFLVRQLCKGAVSYKDVKDRPMLPVLLAWLTGSQRGLVEKHAPERIDLSNGKKAKIVYAAGAPPHIAMRIQELYGVNDTPKIALGRVPLQVHILAPSQRPVQITQDLRGFWRDAYPKVKQELQRKYPRNEWR